MTTEQRRRAYAKGLRAESMAAILLRLKGYRIVGRRVRTRVGEVDLIARRGSVLAFVEVKARTDTDTAAWALGPHQRARIERAAQSWAAGHAWSHTLTWRFDLVLVGGLLPHHVPDAWRPNG